MDYNLSECLESVKEAKVFLKYCSGKYPDIKDLPNAEQIGQGNSGKLFKFKNLAIKCEHPAQAYTIPVPVSRAAKIREKFSKQAIKKKINCAPYLDHITCDSRIDPKYPFLNSGLIWSFMPKLDGVSLGGDGYEDDSAFLAIMKLGLNGIEKYFDDFKKLREIGFTHEDWIYGNYIISDTAINFIDLNILPRQQQNKESSLVTAAGAIVDVFRDPIPGYFRPNADELNSYLSMVENSLLRQKDNSLALKYIRDRDKLTKGKKLSDHYDNLKEQGFCPAVDLPYKTYKVNRVF